MKLSSEKRSEGTISHRRVQLPWDGDRPFRILCIDGGGIKGIFPAKLFALVEQEILGGGSIANHVDLICGTSTGGILGTGIGLGLPATKILNLYIDRGDKIFPPTLNLGLLKLKHARDPLDKELQSEFGDRSFGECIPRMVIPSFDHHLEPTIYKTDHHSDYEMDWKRPAWDVAAATSAAPIFLGAHIGGDRIQWDGGLYANHPLMNGLVDALACYDLSRDNIRVVSIGCGKQNMPVSDNPQKYADAGFLGWALHLAPTASALQLHDSLGQAGLLIGRQNILRIDPELETTIAMDDPLAATRFLPQLAQKAFEETKDSLQDFFAAPTLARERFYTVS